jgi:hypothetical protein
MMGGGDWVNIRLLLLDQKHRKPNNIGKVNEKHQNNQVTPLL